LIRPTFSERDYQSVSGRPAARRSAWSRRCLIPLLLILLLVPAAAWSQSAGNVVLESNEELFCVLAALNAAGYDTGMGANTADDTRLKVREFLQARKAAAAPDLEKFYGQHRVTGDAGADLGQYISLALLIGSPPDFKASCGRRLIFAFRRAVTWAGRTRFMSTC
jgi:hypothetical protein